MIVNMVFGLILGPKPPLSIEVNDAPRKISVGGQWKSKLAYLNQSDTELRVVTANGTEFAQSRPPFLKVFIQKQGAKEWTPLKSPPICGNSNPITSDEFRPLAKAQRQEGQVYFSWTTEVVGQAAVVPGRYALKVVYDTTSPIDSWIGGPLPEPAHSQAREAIRPFFNQVPRGIFASKPVEFVVAATTSARAR